MAAKKEEVSKEKALEQAIGKISKEFGEGSIMKLGNNLNMEIEVITTGSINIDMALGVGGVPKGRIIEVYGAESSGKTTIALHIVAQAQKNGSLSNGVGKKQINFYIAPVENHWSYFVTNNLLVIKILALK